MTRILIVDDDGDVALKILRVCAGKDPGQAQPPDLMVVDFNMKRMNGFELIREARALDPFSRLPILMVTGTTKDIKGAVEMEGVRHVPKWSATRDLVRYIRETVPPVKTAAGEAAPRRYDGPR